MTVLTAAELAGWTPLALNFEDETPSIDWGDLGARRFTEPFFDETIARWAAEDPSAAVVRTDLDALVALDQAPSLDPCGLIFHLSRCGSTLLARLLRQIPGSVVICEPNVVNTLLIASPEVMERETQVQLLRLLIRALGRRRLGDERHYFLKLSSWNIRKLELFMQAFPAAPVVWVQRKPAEVMASLLARSPGWLYWQNELEPASLMFQIDPAELSALDHAAFFARALEAILKAALSAPPGSTTAIDYSELPEAAWTTVAPHFGLSADADDIARMRTEAQYDSKRRRFKPRSGEIPEAIRQVAAERLDGLYRALSRRKAAAPTLPRSAV